MKSLRLDNFSLNGLFIIFIGLSAVISSFVSVGLLRNTLGPTLETFQSNEQQNELDISASLIRKFLDNQVIAYRDLAQLPLIINGSMQGKKNNPDLIDFLGDYRVLGQLHHLAVLDVNGTPLIERGKFRVDLNQFILSYRGYIDRVMNNEIANVVRLISHQSGYSLVIVVPILYSGYAEGALLAEIPLSDNSVFEELDFGSDKSLILRQEGFNYSFGKSFSEIQRSDDEMTILKSSLSPYQLDLDFYIDRSSTIKERDQVIWKVSGSLLAGVILISLLLLVLGKKLILEPTKRIEESEREQRLFRAIIENTSESVIITEAERVDGPDHPKIQYVNEGFERVSGYKMNEVIGKTPRILQGKNRDEDTFIEIKECLEKGKTFSGEILNYTKEGKPYWLEVNIFPIRNKYGELIHFAAVQRDITERKIFLSQIESASRRLGLATEAANIGVWEWNLESGTLAWNSEMWPLYGVSPDIDPSYEVWNSSLHPEDRQFANEAIQNALDGKAEFDTTFRIRTDTFAIRHIRGVAQVLRNDQGVPTSMVGINYDVTQVVEHQKAMTAVAAQAEEANQMKSEFLANMSHEIRTPMNGVIGATTLLLQSDLDSQQGKLANTIKNSGEALLHLINDILDFSKIEAGKFDLNEDEFSLMDLIGDVADVFSFDAHQKDLELSFSYSPEAPDRIVGDSVRLRQILTNILGNAVKFTERGSVSLSIELEDADGEPFLYFEVRDTGIGISSEHQKKLFESFHQVDASISRKFGGTGLGLAISKSLVELMGGQIGVESQEGEGSVFSFTVPANISTQVSELTQIHPELRELRVLYLGYDKMSRQVTEPWLDLWGIDSQFQYSVVDALNVIEKQKIHGQPFEMLIVESNLFKADNKKLLARMTNGGVKGPMRILVGSVQEREMMDPGALSSLDAFLNKPIHPKDFLQTLLSAVRGEVSPERERSEAIDLDFKHADPRVLICEDNRTNLEIVTGLLEKLGVTEITSAANGVDGLQACRERKYDLIFMDIQMPGLDGFQVTESIRREDNLNQDSVVVALTANAMKGDREKCLVSGMNDYLSKPILPNELRNILSNWIASPQDSPAEENSISLEKVSSPELPILNTEDLLGRVMGDQELAEQILVGFLEETEEMIADFSNKSEHNDLERLRELSHTLKGSSLNVGAEGLGQVCKDIERLLKSDKVTAVDLKWEQKMKDEFEKLRSEIKSFREEVS